jgi:hypothetical protein
MYDQQWYSQVYLFGLHHLSQRVSLVLLFWQRVETMSYPWQCYYSQEVNRTVALLLQGNILSLCCAFGSDCWDQVALLFFKSLGLTSRLLFSCSFYESKEFSDYFLSPDSIWEITSTVRQFHSILYLWLLLTQSL